MSLHGATLSGGCDWNRVATPRPAGRRRRLQWALYRRLEKVGPRPGFRAALRSVRRASVLAEPQGGGDDGGAGERLVRLEIHFQYIRTDLDEIKAALKVLPSMPTRADLWSWKIQWTAICVASIAIIVGGIIGGLAWIKPDQTPPVIQVISAPAAPSSAQPALAAFPGDSHVPRP